MKRFLFFMTYLTALCIGSMTLVYAADSKQVKTTPKVEQTVQKTVATQKKVTPLVTATKTVKQPPKSTYRYGKVTAHYLNVRKTPTGKSRITDVLVKNYVIVVKPAKNKPNWYALQGGGYVNRPFVTLVADSEGERLLAIQKKKAKPHPVFKKPTPKKTAPRTPNVTTGKPSLAIVGSANLAAHQYDALLSKTALAGIGSSLVAVEKQYKVNGLFTLAVARLESANGTSRIARDKNNLFGMNAVDGNAYNAAYRYNSKHASIMDFGMRMKRNYFDQGRRTLASINQKYSSSNQWQHKVHSLMVSDARRASY